ncbi:50S ribosomal protein L25 [Candidatus Latescibacterota bacterium]
MAEAVLKAQIREEKGKQVAKRLRRNGLIPSVLYGVGVETTALSIELKELLLLLHTFGRNTVVNLTLAKKKKKIKSFIYEIQHNPISGDIIHLDLKQISMDEKIHVSIPINLIGTPYGVKNEGGIVEHALHTLEIFCLPSEIPKVISVDITDLHLGDSIHVRDLTHDNFNVLSDSESVVVHVITPKVVKVVEVEEEAIEEEEEEPAEPEVIGEEE